MRIILFVAILAPLLRTGHAGFLGNLLFCKHQCNPHPGERLKHCLYKCGWRLGRYYDGSECWVLGKMGTHFQWKGICSKGVCVRSATGYAGSIAEAKCGPITTTQVSVVTTATTFSGLPETSQNHSRTDNGPTYSNITLRVKPSSGNNNTSSIIEAASPTTSTSTTEVKTVTSTSEKQSEDITVTPDTKSSPAIPFQNSSATTAAQADDDAPTTVLFAKETSSETPDANATPKEDTTNANGIIQTISTTSTSATEAKTATSLPGKHSESNAVTPDTKSSPAIPDENSTATTSAQADDDAPTPDLFANKTLLETPNENSATKEDTTKANASIQTTSTTSTSSTTEIQSEATLSGENSNDSKPGTRTYPPRPSWLNARFTSTSTTQITTQTKTSNKGTSTSKASPVDSSHTISTQTAQTSQPTEETESAVNVTTEDVNAARSTAAASSTSNIVC